MWYSTFQSMFLDRKIGIWFSNYLLQLESPYQLPLEDGQRWPHPRFKKSQSSFWILFCNHYKQTSDAKPKNKKKERRKKNLQKKFQTHLALEPWNLHALYLHHLLGRNYICKMGHSLTKNEKLRRKNAHARWNAAIRENWSAIKIKWIITKLRPVDWKF